MIDRIALLGSASGRNAGDAALIDGIARAVDSNISRPLIYEVPTIKPSYINDHYADNVVPVGMLPWNGSIKMLGLPTYRSVKRCDFALIFDAILFDRALYNPLFNFLSTLYLMLPRLHQRGTGMGFYNVGTGPIHTEAGAKMLRAVAHAMDFIAVRDVDSLEVLQSIGCEHDCMFVGADAALNAPSAPPERIDQVLRDIDLPLDEPVLALNINTYLDSWSRADGKSMGREQFLTTYSQAVNAVSAELDVPLLFVSTQHQDVGITQDLMSRCQASTKRFISNTEYNHLEIKGVLGRVSLLFAMRLHAIILASSLLAPVVGLAYQPKVRHYLKTLDLADRCLEFTDFTVDDIVRHILVAWADRDALRATLEHRIPVQQARAMLPAQLMAAIDRGENPAAAFKQLETQLAAAK